MRIREYVNSSTTNFKQAIKLEKPYMTKEFRQGILDYLAKHKSLDNQDFDEYSACVKVTSLIAYAEDLI